MKQLLNQLFEEYSDIKPNQVYNHNRYGKVKIISFYKNNTGDKEKEIPILVSFKSLENKKVFEQGFDGFKSELLSI